ncbi:hypothetical protein [Allorhizobium terrae]|uniref:DUF3035 domain-containing protein n=1 Tax=Allorhizobium terrae TaxID=1848972 RepID=A0A4S3ZRM6_9HYPH|nr:hypothetical protein [Allorhizobium terrae]THF48274.1 hypothetical protein E6C51_15325 [Allorhizobium terrae]TWD51093.1 hypothetical protein FB480_10555 [Agrobacterium vitis]
MVKAGMFRVGATVFGVFAACSALSGCMSSPTYGTDKTALEQLGDDVGSAVSLGASKPKNAGTSYNPRPDLVLPPKGATADLVQPQQSLASKDNPEWVESPEDVRARLVAEADENKDTPGYRSPLLNGYGTNGTMTETQKWEAFRKARAEQKGAYIDQRRLLSDPPASYRSIDEAKLNDLGEPELKKEKRREKEAKMSNSNKSWWLPFQ